MEETSVLDRIQISQATASLLTSGKGHWVKPCNDCDVKVKGKGQMQTYWAYPSNNKFRHGSAKSDADAASVYSESNRHDDEPVEQIDQLLMDKTMHLVDRNVDVMQRILKLMVAQREAVMLTKHPFGTQLNEVVEILSLPHFDANVAAKQTDVDDIQLPEKAVQQLREFIMNIAAM
jgi:hypothetical protein